MLGYATIGAVDLERLTVFYDKLLGLLGAKRIRSLERGVFYGESSFEFAVLKPFDGGEAKAGNGTMTALQAPSRAVVDQVHALAMAAGGTDEGAPGIRGREESGFYGGYFRDPEGNKLCVYKIGQE